MLLTEEDLRKIVRKTIIEENDSKLLKEFEIGRVTGGVQYEMCDLSGIPDMFWTYFDAVKSNKQEKVVEKIDKDIKIAKRNLKESKKSQIKKLDDLKEQKKDFNEEIDAQINDLKNKSPDDENKSSFLSWGEKAYDAAMKKISGFSFDIPDVYDFLSGEDEDGSGSIFSADDESSFGTVNEGFFDLIISDERKIKNLEKSRKKTNKKMDKEIKKLQDSIANSKFQKEIDNLEKEKEQLNEPGMWESISNTLEEHSVFRILEPFASIGGNIIASSLMGLSSGDCDRIKDAIADFLFTIGQFRGVPIEKATIRNAAGAAKKSNSNKDKSDSSLGTLEEFFETFHDGMVKNRIVDADQRKKISTSSNKPKNITDFELDLFELIANDEYRKFSSLIGKERLTSKTMQNEIKSAKDILKDFIEELRKNDSSFSVLGGKFARLINVDDKRDKGRGDRAQKYVLAKNFPYDKFFDKSKNLNVIIAHEIKTLISNLELD